MRTGIGKEAVSTAGDNFESKDWNFIIPGRMAELSSTSFKDLATNQKSTEGLVYHCLPLGRMTLNIGPQGCALHCRLTCQNILQKTWAAGVALLALAWPHDHNHQTRAADLCHLIVRFTQTEEDEE